LVTMTFGAIYLDHHWVIDVVVGFAYTVATYLLVQSVGARVQAWNAAAAAQAS